MAAYIVARINVTDPAWIEEYVPAVQAQVEAAGGRYLARSGELDVLESNGGNPDLVAVLEFPSTEVAKTWYNSTEYKPQLDARIAGSESELILVEGL